MSKFSEVATQLTSNQKSIKFTFTQKESALRLLQRVLDLLFPHNLLSQLPSSETITLECETIETELQSILAQLVSGEEDALAEAFVRELPSIQKLLLLDIEAIFNGDPAAKSREEVILSYPGMLAISIHRIAHFFYQNKVSILPRVLSEFAHCHTGIDIHPGAQIGESFCIDHGTGIVIGETTIIKNRVKIYQGVTLGALSVQKSMSSQKRHPTVEDDVVIYANTTILGGTTVIGKGSIIGGNAWVTESIHPLSKIFRKADADQKTYRASYYGSNYLE